MDSTSSGQRASCQSMRGAWYHRYQLFEDGTAYCVVWYILADPEKTLRIPEDNKKKPTKSLERNTDGDQWVTQESGVTILGCCTRGYTMSEIKKFCKNPERAPKIGALVTQWQPQLEAGVHQSVRKPKRKPQQQPQPLGPRLANSDDSSETMD